MIEDRRAAVAQCVYVIVMVSGLDSPVKENKLLLLHFFMVTSLKHH